MAYLRAKDTVNGALGTCYARIDGERHELMQVKNVTATVKKTRTEIPILGLTGKQHKSGGREGTGKMTVYYVSSLFRKVMLDYMKNGVDTYFELMLTNEDPTGETGKQTVLLKDVNIDEMVIGKLDVDQFALEGEADYTLSGDIAVTKGAVIDTMKGEAFDIGNASEAEYDELFDDLNQLLYGLLGY